MQLDVPERTARVDTRLVMVSQPTSGGTAVVVRQLAEGLVGRGFDVTVVAPAGGDLLGWLEPSLVRRKALPMRRRPGWMDLRAVLTLRRIARDADILHLHSSKAGAVGRLAMIGLRDRPRIIFTPHAWSWNAGTATSRLYAAFERWAVRYSDLTTMTSCEERDEGRSVLGAAPRMKVIENGVDTDYFSQVGPSAARDSTPLLLCVGRLTRQKGQDRLLRALAMHLSDCRLRLIGSGPDESRLRDLAAELGVVDRVEFVGDCDPRPHYRAADVVVCASRWEGMSLVVLEAMACGAAIVSTDCGGSSALNDGAGVVVPAPNDQAAVSALGLALRRLVDEPAGRAQLRSSARQQAVSRFALARVIDEFHTAYLPGAPMSSIGSASTAQSKPESNLLASAYGKHD